MNLTYADLKKKLNEMTAEELQDNVTVYVEGFDEYFPIESIKAVGDIDDVIDEGCHVLYTPKE